MECLGGDGVNAVHEKGPREDRGLWEDWSAGRPSSSERSSAHERTLVLRGASLGAALATDERECHQDDHGDHDKPDVEHEIPSLDRSVAF
jgi:hypothetical protein